jgi:hypothetical protein
MRQVFHDVTCGEHKAFSASPIALGLFAMEILDIFAFSKRKRNGTDDHPRPFREHELSAPAPAAASDTPSFSPP